jgi:hypothetical protein
MQTPFSMAFNMCNRAFQAIRTCAAEWQQQPIVCAERTSNIHCGQSAEDRHTGTSGRAEFHISYHTAKQPCQQSKLQHVNFFYHLVHQTRSSIYKGSFPSLFYFFKVFEIPQAGSNTGAGIANVCRAYFYYNTLKQ